LQKTTKKAAKDNARIEQENAELEQFNDWVLTRLFPKWLERGDGVAVYENQDPGSANVGHKKFCSFGSPAAQLEQSEPPQRMPDIGALNWAYRLVASYRIGGSNETQENTEQAGVPLSTTS